MESSGTGQSSVGYRSCSCWGFSLPRSNTHPAAPAIPSPRRRETSFSLPRLRDSRILEKELLRRRVWRGRQDPSQPHFSSSPRPRSGSQAHLPSSPVRCHQLCLHWELPEGQAGPRGAGSLGTALLLAGTCSVSGRPRPAGRMGDRGSDLELPWAHPPLPHNFVTWGR